MFYVIQNNVVSLQTNIIQMAKQDIKKGRGGARPGAGRPRKQEESKLYSFRASGGISKYLDAQEQKTTFMSLYGLEQCEREVRTLTEQAVQAVGSVFSNAEFLQQLARSLETRRN